MLGLSLLFVGFTLIHNGVCALRKDSDPKASAIVNLSAGGLLALVNAISLTGAAATQSAADFQNTAAGFLFAFTYIFIGLFLALNKDFFHVGLYGAFAAAAATFYAAFALKSGDYLMGALWILWFLLWAELPLAYVFKLNMKRFPAYFLIFEGLVAAAAPAVYLLFFV